MQLRIHIRTLITLTGSNKKWLKKQLDGCQKVFGDSMEITQTGESAADFNGGSVQVGGCKQLTDDQIYLFRQREGLEDTDVLVLIARALKPPSWGGCAIHPDHQPGVVLAAGRAYDPPWLLAHELGHVLGLQHVRDKRRLMYEFTKWAPNTTPALDATEKATVEESTLRVP